MLRTNEHKVRELWRQNRRAGEKMLKQFIRNEDGNYAVIFALASLPIFASVGMAVDYSNVTRLKTEMTSSIDAACIAVGKEFLTGTKTDEQLRTYSSDYFYANFTGTSYGATTVTTTLPTDAGNLTKELKCKGQLEYKTMFGGVLAYLTGSPAMNNAVIIKESTMRMKNVAEIALVLDNSGSMLETVSGGGTRMQMVKDASQQLVTNIMDLAAKIQQVSDPVKFAIVPFSASVNIGNSNANRTASWMDTRGISPVHHEHLNWGAPSTTNSTGFRSIASDGAKLDASGIPLTRFSILDQLRFYDDGTESATTANCQTWVGSLGTSTSSSNSTTANCAVFKRTGGTTKLATSSDVATEMGTSVAALQAKYQWGGCVESRPYPYNITDQLPTSGNPATLFVPWFAPDEYNNQRYGIQSNSSTSPGTTGWNNWWPDNDPATIAVTVAPTMANASSSAWQTGTARPRETDVAKYFLQTPYLYGSGTATSTSATRKGQWQYFKAAAGPNYGCTTSPITPLTTSRTTLTAAINAMAANGATNVTEGLAWGWKVISSGAPFTEGAAETRKDIDKVVIVVTDGRNTYYTPESLGYVDYAANKSIYSAQGFPGWNGNSGTNGIATQTSSSNRGRVFQNTSISATAFDNGSYSSSMIQQMDQLCTNVKGQNIILMTIGLDLDPAAASAGGDADMITALQQCAGASKTRKDGSGNAVKLFWNACGSNSTSTSCKSLNDTFKEVADELSNLRFTN